MVKKLFALASVTALTGLVAATGAAGCSSSSTTTEAPSDASTGADAKKSTSSSSGTPSTSSGDTGDADTSTTCASKDPVDATQFAYTKALDGKGSCTLDEVKALAAYIAGLAQGADIDLAAWQKSVSAKCSACAFTDETAGSWGPILVKDGKLSSLNGGGCLELVSAKSDCGKAYFQLDQCTYAACDPQQSKATCSSQDDYDACVQSQDVYDGPCNAAVKAVQTACGSNIKAYLTSCQPPSGEKYTFEGYVNVQCVTGGSGGGADAGDGG